MLSIKKPTLIRNKTIYDYVSYKSFEYYPKNIKLIKTKLTKHDSDVCVHYTGRVELNSSLFTLLNIPTTPHTKLIRNNTT